MTQSILRIDASARHAGSASRAFADAVLAGVPDAAIAHRDLASGVPQITEAYTSGTFKSPDKRTAAERAALALSDEMLAEVLAADTLLITTGIYNFSIPASLKAWIDQVTRAGLAFRYTATGPVGLLTGKRALVALASGGTRLGAPNDFASPYLRYALSFIGIEDVTFFEARGGEAEVARAAQTLAPAIAA